MHFLLMLFRVQARNPASKPEIRPQNSRKNVNHICLNFGWQFWRVQDAFRTQPPFLADVVQLSSQKSASEARAKIRLNLVDFSVAIWAGPEHFF